LSLPLDPIRPLPNYGGVRGDRPTDIDQTYFSEFKLLELSNDTSSQLVYYASVQHCFTERVNSTERAVSKLSYAELLGVFDLERLELHGDSAKTVPSITLSSK